MHFNTSTCPPMIIIWQLNCARDTKSQVGQAYLVPWIAAIGYGLNARRPYRVNSRKAARKEQPWCTSAHVTATFLFGTVFLRYLGHVVTSMCWTCPHYFFLLPRGKPWPSSQLTDVCYINRMQPVQLPFKLSHCRVRYLLVDGIYPEWTCFLGPISRPKTTSEKHYTNMQASRRKDIERAFGALQIKWHILNKPSLTPDITLMNRILSVCVIMHNMVFYILFVQFAQNFVDASQYLANVLGGRRKT